MKKKTRKKKKIENLIWDLLKSSTKFGSLYLALDPSEQDNSQCHSITWENSGSRRNQRQHGVPKRFWTDGGKSTILSGLYLDGGSRKQDGKDEACCKILASLVGRNRGLHFPTVWAGNGWTEALTAGPRRGPWVTALPAASAGKERSRRKIHKHPTQLVEEAPESFEKCRSAQTSLEIVQLLSKSAETLKM